ncbi:Response regulator [Hoeflea phototrophica DFL-43]|jgi:two-component system nitrate/nitrite response regulator NarL|uniref:Response regulator n=1 Tax=Hoeflea phototrophica (strain DSM 17068 / NCIMB 14078 / DFL-43) TaxID=411684 RepID=A9D6Y1_HOEPD|nr:response regulator transcription factor [Hoeflea phototrophica]EDQ33618.1 Response regulator [Hoeflea phototrophica DFL-43]
MSNVYTIVVVDDHPLFREGVARSLNEADFFEVVGECGCAEDAFDLVETHLPDIVCLDISMPGGGINAARRINATFPTVKIVMLTVSEADENVSDALEAGASGYILKGIGAAQLVEALSSVASGQSYISPDLAVRLLTVATNNTTKKPEHPIDNLTRREEQILQLVANGLSNKEVGAALDLQEKTIKHYMTNILQKLHVRNRVEAALLARDRGLSDSV